MNIIHSISVLATVAAVAIPSVASADPIRQHRDTHAQVQHDRHDRGRDDHRWNEHHRWEHDRDRHDRDHRHGHGRRR